MMRQVDSSLLEEWERMRDPEYQPLGRPGHDARQDLRPPGADEARGHHARTRAFTAAVRTRIFTFLREWDSRTTGVPPVGPGVPPLGPSVPPVAEFRAEHGALRLDPEARNIRHTYVTASGDGQTWRVQQMLVDTEDHNDWVAEFEVDLAASREKQEAVVRIVRVGPVEDDSRQTAGS